MAAAAVVYRHTLSDGQGSILAQPTAVGLEEIAIRLADTTGQGVQTSRQGAVVGNASPASVPTPANKTSLITECAYLTDVEGNYEYFCKYVEISKVVKWADAQTKERIVFTHKHTMLVFGGDSQDKGIGDIRFTKLLLDLKAQRGNEDRVQFIIGNRDANKLRFASELQDECIQDPAVLTDKSFPYWVPEDKRVTPQMFLLKAKADDDKGGKDNTVANRLRYILDETMGAAGNFERRREELCIIKLGKKEGEAVSDEEKASISDDDVVVSYRNEVNPTKDQIGKYGDDKYSPTNDQVKDNFMLQYLRKAKLAFIFGETLFLHGAVDPETIGRVPGTVRFYEKVREWVQALNEWAAGQILEFEQDPYSGANTKGRKGFGLMDYGVPGGNESRTVVYNNFLHNGNGKHVHLSVQEYLLADQISQVISGHQPHGDCPLVIRTGSVRVITADTSYSQFGHKSSWGVDNRGDAVSEVIVTECTGYRSTSVQGRLADGSEILYTLAEPDHQSGDARLQGDKFVGRQLSDGSWVKAKVAASDEYLLCFGEGQKLTHSRKTAAELEALDNEVDNNFLTPEKTADPPQKKLQSFESDVRTRWPAVPQVVNYFQKAYLLDVSEKGEFSAAGNATNLSGNATKVFGLRWVDIGTSKYKSLTEIILNSQTAERMQARAAGYTEGIEKGGIFEVSVEEIQFGDAKGSGNAIFLRGAELWCRCEKEAGKGEWKEEFLSENHCIKAANQRYYRPVGVRSGRITFPSNSNNDPARYMIVSDRTTKSLNPEAASKAKWIAPGSEEDVAGAPSGISPEMYNIHLIRCLVEQKWHLERPDVIISVTGGAQAFDLPSTDKELIMKGLMDGTRTLKPIFITGGSNSGIMKYVGEARAKYNPTAPLIGIGCAGPVLGTDSLLWRQFEERKHDQTSILPSKALAAMDHNHSHFILVENEDGSFFGAENALRGEFEKCLSAAYAMHAQDIETPDVERMKHKSKLQRTLSVIKDGVDEVKQARLDPVPIVSICVQGGPGTITTVLNSVLGEIPSQVVKGSGKAADLLADVVILTDVNGKGDSEPKDQAQFQLNDVLQSLVISSEDAVARYDIFEAIDTLKNWEHSDIETDIQRSTDVKLRSLMTESYSIVMKGAGNGTTKHLYKYLRETLEAVSTGLVFVFDLKEASSDFNGALLKALMSSFERSDFAGKSLHEKAWYKLKYTMLWGRDDLVHEQLEEVMPQLTDAKIRNDFLHDAVIYALQRNKVHALKSLLDFNAEMSRFEVLQQSGGLVSLLQQILHDHSKAQRTSSDRIPLHQGLGNFHVGFETAMAWTELIEYFKNNNPVFNFIWSEVKQKFQCKTGEQAEEYKKTVQNCDRMSSMSPDVRHASLALTSWLLELSDENANEVSMLGNTSLDEHEKAVLASFEQLRVLETMYRSLLGEKIRYRLGMLGAHLDLFFLCVIVNQKELAFEIWKECDFPVRAAIVAASLFRAVADFYEYQDPLISTNMRDSADFFETLAIEVQTCAFEEDHQDQLALNALDINMLLFQQDTILDLVVAHDCTHFLAKCCSEAITLQLYGDMQAFHMGTAWGVCKILLGIVTLGFAPAFIPTFVDWMPPPTSESMRRSKQRRFTPKGFPYLRNKEDTAEKKKMWDIYVDANFPIADQQKEKGLKEHEITARLKVLSSEQLSDFWDPSFMWYERLYLFWITPIVLFYTDKIVALCMTLVFTLWFVAARYGSEKILQPPLPFKVPEDLNVEPLQGVEIMLCIYFASSYVREATEVLLDMAQNWENKWQVIKEYLSDFWNMLDMGEIFFFFVGVGFRVNCQMRGDECTSIRRKIARDSDSGADVVQHGDAWVNWSMCYGLCLFIMWFRVLRSFMLSRLGVIVAVFNSMLNDVAVFMVIYCIMVGSCTMLFLGIAPRELLSPTCDGSDEDVSFLQCQVSYILLRTLFQSFGEFFLEEMNSTTAMFFLIFTFVLLNLVLMNLLIALMASTYEVALENTVVERLIDKYNLVRDASYVCFSAPVPLNIIAIIVELITFMTYKEAVDKKFPDCRLWRKLELFLRRNKQPWTWNNNAADDEDRGFEGVLNVSACMERARSKALEDNQFGDEFEAFQYEDGHAAGLNRLRDKVDAVSSQLENVDGSTNHTLCAIQTRLDTMQRKARERQGGVDAELKAIKQLLEAIKAKSQEKPESPEQVGQA